MRFKTKIILVHENIFKNNFEILKMVSESASLAPQNTSRARTRVFELFSLSRDLDLFDMKILDCLLIPQSQFYQI
jgi:hypothetical protein